MAAPPPDQTARTLRQAALAAYASGDPQAGALLAAARRESAEDGGLLIAEATLAQEAGDPAALANLCDMLERAPDWRAGHDALARLRWGRGESDDFLGSLEAALTRLPRAAPLWMLRMDLLAEAGRPAAAADLAATLRRQGDAPSLRLIEARHRGAAGDLDAAERLLAGLPDDLPSLAFERARHALRRGDPALAEARLACLRTQSPDDAAIWALTELCWRATSDPRHPWLLDPDRLIGTYPIDLDPELAPALRAIHARRWPPLGQSLRNGTQTRGHLADRLEPSIGATFRALASVVREHCARLREEPPHPLARWSSANPGFRAAWSIRLSQEGYHVAHIHPGGLLSSALHIAAGGSDAPSGALELGRPPPAFAMLGLEAIRTLPVQPSAVHLFPSFLYHGTTVFSGSERLTMAFDVS